MKMNIKKRIDLRLILDIVYTKKRWEKKIKN